MPSRPVDMMWHHHFILVVLLVITGSISSIVVVIISININISHCTRRWCRNYSVENAVLRKGPATQKGGNYDADNGEVDADEVMHLSQ